MGHYFAQNSTLNPVGLNIYDNTKYVKWDLEIQMFGKVWTMNVKKDTYICNLG